MESVSVVVAGMMAVDVDGKKVLEGNDDSP